MRRIMWGAAALGLLASFGASAQPLELKPDLQALPAHDLSVELDFLSRPTLRFGTTTWNAGDGPLEIAAGETGQDRNGRNRQNVYQIVSLDDGSSYQRLVGNFVWHPGHSHFHMDDYAVYTLQPLKAKGKSKRTSSKTSFCLVDTTQVDGTLPNAPNQPVYSGCDNLFQGISVGWGDEYGAHLPGQNIDLTDLADGDYRLSIEVDPKGRLIETNAQNNTSCVLLRIGVSALSLEVLNPSGCEEAPPPAAPVIAGISPDSGSKGSLVPVTISGSGFAAGMSVSLENGSGPAPVVSDVAVPDATTITASVTIKKGGGGNDPVWDLRVGSAVLSDAFTVLP